MYRKLALSIAALALGVFAAWPALAQGMVKIGVLEAMTGGQASTGKQTLAAMRLYMQQNGDTVAGKKIEVILKDDGGVPDNTKRLAQELIVNDKVELHRRLRRDAGRARGRPAGDAGQDPGDRDGGGHLDHHRAFALYRAHQLHAGAVVRRSSATGPPRTASRRSRP